jgi:hypothetical protein
MAGIFINYRRDDVRGVAGRLYDHLTAKFSKDEVFMDVDAMKPGMDFVRQLDTSVSQCHVFLAMIGPNWLDAKDRAGKRRLDDSGDFVRVELASALKREIPVIPVLIDGAEMPPEDRLPDDLKPLARRHALELRHTRFNSDADTIVGVLEKFSAPARHLPWRLIGAAAGLAAVVVAGVVLLPMLIGSLHPVPAPPANPAIAPLAQIGSPTPGLNLDVTGIWSGTATSEAASYPYEWNLKQTGSRVDGIVRISSNDGSSYGLFNMTGSVSGDTIAFQGTSFIEKQQGAGISWCMPAGSVTYYGSLQMAKLEGTWGPNPIAGGCPNGRGGAISLARSNAKLAAAGSEQMASLPPPSINIAGSWNGTYYYDANVNKPVTFSFYFDAAGSGRSEEDNTFGEKSAPKLFATLKSSASSLVAGEDITIVKTYDGTGGVSHAVTYIGSVSTDLRSIFGRWETVNWRGNFTISR